MDKILNLLGTLIPLLTFYPKWAQGIFLLAFALLLTSLFVFVMLYTSATKQQSDGAANGAPISTEVRKNIEVLNVSSDPEQVRTAVSYFKSNPSEHALSSLARVAGKEETKFVMVRDDAIEAIGSIDSTKARDLLLQRAVAETTPGVKADYVSALHRFNDPSMVEPLISIIQNAGGDVVGYPALTLARKLGDPRLTTIVHRHLQEMVNGPISRGYFELGRNTIIDLQIIALHNKVGLKLNLPESLDLLMSKRNKIDFEQEQDVKTRIVDLNYLKRHKKLVNDDLALLISDSLVSTDIMVRWESAELASNLDSPVVRDELRRAFQSERVAFMDAVLIEAISRDWIEGDCSMVAAKIREYSIADEYRLSSYVEAGDSLVRELVRHQCVDARNEVELFAEALETTRFHDREAESIRRATKALSGE